MRSYSLRHLGDHDLLRSLHTAAARDRGMTAEVLAHIAEVDTRRLYLPAGYPSMNAYCIHELHFSEDAAAKRIHAARAARDFPAIFTALAEGRLHLTGVCLLAPHRTHGNADELLASAVHQTKAQIEQLIAQRFPRSEMLALVQPIPASAARAGSVEERVGKSTGEHAPAHVHVADERSKAKPHASGRCALHLVITQDSYDELEYAQALLSHAIPSGDLAKVLERLISLAVPEAEKLRFAATDRPRSSQRGTAAGKRTIPAHVKRAVWRRDRGECTFVGEGGHRCASRKFLELDHVDPVARGGQSTVENLRLRCRAHNQFEAERTFGAGFMNEKREEARRAASDRRAAANAHAEEDADADAATHARGAEMEVRARATEANAGARSVAQEQAMDVMAGLRQLGFRADEVRRAAEFSKSIASATLEERMRAALRFLGPNPRIHGRVEASVGMAT